jgi:drug/metabolite transporter (DMT)-like permease
MSMAGPPQSALRGIAWMVLAAIGYSLNAGIVKQMSAELGAMEIVFWRTVVAVALLAPWLWLRSRGALSAPRRMPLFVLRSLLTYLGMVASYFALARMPIAEVYALQFTLPLFTILGAVLVLRERAGFATWVACAVGFAGALLILRPGFVAVSIAAIAALGAAALYGASNVTIRILSRSESAVVITFYGNLLILPLALVPVLFDWTTPGLHMVPWIVALGVVTTAGQWALARAIAAADARVVMPFDFLRLPFTAALGYAMFAERPDGWTWAGAVVIFCAAYWTVRREATAR